VLSGQTNFEFFDDKEGLFRFVGPRKDDGKPPATLTGVQNIGVIRGWIVQRFNEYKEMGLNFELNAVALNRQSPYFYYDVTFPNRTIQRLQFIQSKSRQPANVRFTGEKSNHTFGNQKELGTCLDKMLKINTANSRQQPDTEKDSDENTDEVSYIIQTKNWVEECKNENKHIICEEITTNKQITDILHKRNHDKMLPGHLYYKIIRGSTTMIFKIVPMGPHIDKGYIELFETGDAIPFTNKTEFKTFWNRILQPRTGKPAKPQKIPDIENTDVLRQWVEISKREHPSARCEEITDHDKIAEIIQTHDLEEVNDSQLYYEITLDDGNFLNLRIMPATDGGGEGFINWVEMGTFMPFEDKNSFLESWNILLE
jgi:hypothetical protein